MGGLYHHIFKKSHGVVGVVFALTPFIYIYIYIYIEREIYIQYYSVYSRVLKERATIQYRYHVSVPLNSRALGVRTCARNMFRAMIGPSLSDISAFPRIT